MEDKRNSNRRDSALNRAARSLSFSRRNRTSDSKLPKSKTKTMELPLDKISPREISFGIDGNLTEGKNKLGISQGDLVDPFFPKAGLNHPIPGGGRSVISLITAASIYSEFNSPEVSAEPEEPADDLEAEELDDAAEDEIELARAGRHKTVLQDSMEFKSLTSLEKSIVRILESKRQLICGVESSKIISSNKNIKARAISLSQKLQSTFDIGSEEALIDDYSCWLLRDVLLQGHLYITKNYLLFFAYLPGYKERKGKATVDLNEKVIMSGGLSMKKYSVTSIKTRYWCVLKGSSFSVYSQSTELYFPLLTIDLRDVVKVELVKKNLNGLLTKLVGKAEESTPKEDTDCTLVNEIKLRKSWANPEVIEDPHGIRIITENNTYLFYSDNLDFATTWVSKIKTQIFSLKNKDDKVTIKLPLRNVVDLEVNTVFEDTENIRVKVLESSESFALDDYFFLFFNRSNAVKCINEALSASVASIVGSEPSIISDNYVPSIHESIDALQIVTNEDTETDEENFVGKLIPVTTTKDLLTSANKLILGGGTRALKILNPKFLLKSIVGQTVNGYEMWSSNPSHYEEINSLERGKEDRYFVTSTAEREQAALRFRKHFSLPLTESLIATYYAYLQRNVPIYGKIYLGNTKLCFRSLLPGVHTHMILPFNDIENCYKEKNFSFGYSGLVVVINGHEELFFEFSTNESRDDSEYLLLKQLDLFKKKRGINSSDSDLSQSVQLSSSTNNLSEGESIRKIESKISLETGFQVPIIMKDLTVSDRKFKPKQKHKITCLTIGSRGDVQPYLALAKQLMKDGHELTIATHGEFKEVVESHGIQFKEIAGDPTELMSFMGDHGTISVTFIKEAKVRFTSWIDKLLITAWDACQGTDILIESPSAMAGIHIAEALNIPYFRAFTMPWTRTRAYPHAFIVPNLKKGGSYNYFTHVMFENVFWKGIASQVNRWRRESLGLDKTDLYQLHQNKVPFLYNISPTVFPPSVDFGNWVKVTGYWFLNEKKTYEPPVALVKFISDARAKGKKIVYIGFGSIVVPNPEEITQAVVEAVQKAEVCCILNKGWSRRLESSTTIEVELPPEIYNSGAIPHDWLFRQIDAAVHHGGSGTTGASLRAGLPTIIKPFFGDQFFYGQRVEDMNVGVSLKNLDRDTLAKALKYVITDTRIIDKAKLIGKKIRSEKGVENAVEAIYSQLDYAQALVTAKRNERAVREKVDQVELKSN